MVGQIGGARFVNREEILVKISDLYHSQFVQPFPYVDTDQIKADFDREFASLEDEGLNSDFNDYCTSIIGASGYVIKDEAANIPKRQIDLLREGFFQRFPQYSIIATSLKNYPNFHIEYQNHERLRKLLLDYLFSE